MLDRRERVRFLPKGPDAHSEDYIDVYLEQVRRDEWAVMLHCGGGALAITPQSSNVAYVRITNR